DVGRPAAAGGYRPGPGQRAGAAGRRRADRGAGHCHRARDRRAAPRAQPRGADAGPGHPRPVAGPPVRGPHRGTGGRAAGRYRSGGAGMSWFGRASRWLGPIRTATGGARRHKVQAAAIGLVVLIATASATLGLALLAASHSPFQHAFASQHGADATVTVNLARASAGQLAATRTGPGVTATSGPFTAAPVPVQTGGQPFGQLTLAGRSSAGGPVDDVVLTAGHWPDGPGPGGR